MKKFAAFITALALLLIVTPRHSQVSAMDLIQGDSVSVPKDTVVDSSVFISGNTVRVEGEVNGDVFCAGKDVTITGAVHGDILCAGQTVTINNVTDGNIRVAAQTVSINGTVGANVTAFAQTETISESAAITGELLTGAQDLRMDGWVGRDISGWTSSTVIDGQVDRDVLVDTDSLTVGDGAVIAGKVNYTSDQKASISQSASISGAVAQTTPAPETRKPTPAKVATPFFQTMKTIAGGMFLLTTILIGGMLAFLFPKGLLTVVATMRENWLMTAVRGLIVLIVTPIVIFFLAITIIGIPAAFLLGMAFLAAYFVGRIYTTLLVGQLILESLYKEKSESIWWILGAGLLVLWAAFTIPVLGGIISFLTTLFGLGGVTYLFTRSSSRK